MLMVVVPLVSVVTTEVKPPPVSATVPVGVGLPPPPLTTTATERLWAVVMLNEDGVTVTAGVIFAGVVTVTSADPDALL
jgi:hypothetical protein